MSRLVGLFDRTLDKIKGNPAVTAPTSSDGSATIPIPSPRKPAHIASERWGVSTSSGRHRKPVDLRRAHRARSTPVDTGLCLARTEASYGVRSSRNKAGFTFKRLAGSAHRGI
ncbi:hypothetical protein RhiTH_011378 [Rhizoctonia solani]